MRHFNKHQTQLTEDLLNKIPREERQDLLEYIDSIQFIQNLASPDRKYAKDFKRWDNPFAPLTSEDPDVVTRKEDPNGRIAIDLSNPHILEDMDYFRPAALHFEKHGVYTKLYPNKNPNSDYYKFWKEEARRCRQGYVRPYDGEWIPGNYYFQLNYAPLLRTEIIEGTKRADRVEAFPYIYDADYWFFHYIEICRAAGMHGANLKRRGCGYSVKASNMLAKNFILGDTEKARKKVKSFAIANEKEYLTKDGILNKFVSVIDFCATHTAFPRVRSIKDSLNDMHWRMGRKDLRTGTEVGTLNEVMGVTLKNDAQKARGKRGALVLWEECFGINTEILMHDGSFKKIQDINVGDLTMGIDSKPRKVELKHNGTSKLYKVSMKNGEDYIVNGKHKLDIVINGTEAYKDITEISVEDYIKSSNTFKKYCYKRKSEAIEYPHKDTKIDPYLLGLWLGDGDSKRVSICCHRDDFETIEYLKLRKGIDHIYHKDNCLLLSKSNKSRLFKDFKDENLIDNKHIPLDYKINSIEVRLQLIAGLIDSDGSLCYKKTNKSRYFEFSQKRENIFNDFVDICRSLGLRVNIIKNKVINKQSYFRCNISGNINIIPTKLSRKKANTSTRNNHLLSSFSITPIDEGEYFGITLSGKDNRLILGDYTIDKNCGKFDNFLTAWGIARPSVEESGYAFGFMMAGGTGGVEGAAFEGLEEIFYNSSGHNIYSIPNVFDKNTNGRGRCAFFFGTYLNYKGKFDENGNSDVIGALIEINKERSKVKYGASDPNAIVQKKAEEPITPQEAIMRSEGTAFPISDLRDYLEDIMPRLPEFIGEHWTGTLSYNDNGVLVWNNDTNKDPIRDYPFVVKGGNSDGCIEIFEMPKKDRDGNVFRNRYIAGIDPIDNDYTTGGSLASIFIFDLWTDRIVAEYTARPRLAEEFYEVCLRLLTYYNAQANYENNLKGLFGYFSNKNALYLLADTPEILRDMEMIKSVLHGNRSKGTRTTKEVINLGKTLQRQWMLSQYEKEVLNETTQEVEIVNIPNLRRIRSIGYIKECIAWNPDINTDRVSAMDMVMILREDKKRLIDKNENLENKDDVMSYFHDDPFIDSNLSKIFDNFNNNNNII